MIQIRDITIEKNLLLNFGSLDLFMSFKFWPL